MRLLRACVKAPYRPSPWGHIERFGNTGLVGMAGMACSIDVNHATIEPDIDPSDEEETVEDSSGTLEGGGAVLTSYSGGLHRITESTAQDAMEDWVEPELTLDHIRRSFGVRRNSCAQPPRKCVKSPVPTAMPLIKSCVPATVCDKGSQLERVDCNAG